MNNYDQILEHFCNKDESRANFLKPFNYEGTDDIFATDFHVLVSIPKHFCSEKYETINTVNVLKSFPKKTIIQPLSVDVLCKALSVIPSKLYYEKKDCNECDAMGSVSWQYKSHTKQFDCPVCNGAGDFPTGKSHNKRDIDYCVSIGENYFYGDVLDKLVFAAQKADVKEIHLRNISEFKKYHLYDVGGIDVLICPIYEPTEIVISL
jgi:hypothetical protein